MRIIKHSFDSHYHDNFLYRETDNSQRNQERLKVLMEYRQNGNLLEIGFGQAGFLRLAEKHFNVEGCDVSVHAVQTNREHFGERVKVLNIERHPIAPQSQDIIAVFNILEHLRRPTQVVDRIHNGLSGQGLMIGSVPNNSGLIGKSVTRLGNFFDRTHISTLTPDTWERIFKKAGFAKIELFGEINFGRNRCRYVRRNFWSSVAFNLMFVCQKS
jgi:2-polyprenyl-3-methyl-5-hydroxy-6-metoxy-1,4-benzoquinol methylase